MPEYTRDTHAILEAISENRSDMEKKLDSLHKEQAQVKEEVKALRYGFPEGDPDAHRKYHETIIEWRELRNKLVREALENAAKVGVLGAIAWFAYAVWVALKMEVNK